MALRFDEDAFPNLLVRDIFVRAADRGGLRDVAVHSQDGTSVTYERLAELVANRSDSRHALMLRSSNTVSSLISYLTQINRRAVTILVPDSSQSATLESIAATTGVFTVVEPSGEAGITALAGSEFGHEAELRTTMPVLAIPTSGSTGGKKIVRLSDANLHANALDIVNGLSMDETEVSITSLAFTYSYGLSVVNSTLLAGGKLVVGDFDVIRKPFRKALSDFGVTHLAGVPTQHEMYLKTNLYSEAPRTLRTITQAGGGFSESRTMAVLDLLPPYRSFYKMYGQTEATARMAILPHEHAREKPWSVGRVLGSGSFSVGSSEHPDEIQFSGPNVMLGYWSTDLEDPSQDFQNGRLATGDLGFIENGFLGINGRIKRILKVNGLRLSLDELDERIRSAGVPASSVVIDDFLYIFHSSKSEVDEKKVRQVLEQIGLRHTNFSINYISSLPLTDSGKVAYAVLEELASDLA